MASNATARLSRLLAPICLGATLLGLTAPACSVPDFGFEAPPLGAGGDGAVVVPHCRNGELDADQGESDFDCGRGCDPCGVAQRCNDQADCADGLLCSEGSCVEAGCMNQVRDGAETDVDCGGDGCKPCSAEQACAEGSDCESAVCEGGKCQGASCDDRVKNGRETSVDCGGGCDPCAVDEPCLVNKDCLSGECNDRVCGAICDVGFANCDRDNANACEVNTETDLRNCGGCGKPCELAHAAAECSGGECRIQAAGCEEGYEDCDGDPANGCEVDLKTNELNCGACSKLCPDLNGAPSCVAGRCQITCDDGFEDCDGSRDNGCEVNLQSSSQSCGECTKKCAADSGYSAYCKDGACGQTQCPAGKGDCNGDQADGCEVTLTNDAENCGTCGTTCGAANANTACESGKCVVSACVGDFGDCSGGYADGCETNTLTSAAHCGKCGAACGTTNASATGCNAGKCEPTCNAGWGSCAAPDQGCTTRLGTTANCGKCGQSCSGSTPFCGGSGCVASRDVEIVLPGLNTSSGWIGNNGTPAEIRVNHNLLTPRTDAVGNANNRMVLLAVTATDNYTEMEDITVTYAGTKMEVAFEQLDEGKNSYAGVYYLLESALPEAGNAKPIVVTVGKANTWGHAAIDVVELRNVMQVAPIATGGAGANTACNPVARRSASINFNQAGTFVYGVLAAYHATAAAIVDDTATPLTSRLQSSPDRLLMATAYTVASSSRTFTWDVTGCYNTAIALVAIKRLSAN